jgi:hypothetical protein
MQRSSSAPSTPRRPPSPRGGRAAGAKAPTSAAGLTCTRADAERAKVVAHNHAVAQEIQAARRQRESLLQVKEQQRRQRTLEASLSARASLVRGLEARAEEVCEDHREAARGVARAFERAAQQGAEEQWRFQTQQEERVRQAVDQRHAMRTSRENLMQNRQESADRQIATRLARCVAVAEEEREGHSARQRRADAVRVSTQRGMHSAREGHRIERENAFEYVRSERRQHESEVARQRRAYQAWSQESSGRVMASASPHAMRRYKQEEVARKHAAASEERGKSREYAARAIAVRAEEQMMRQRLHDKVLLAKHGLA